MALENIDREKLKTIIRARSYRTGNITLASGKQSDYYFDMKPTMLDPQGSVLIAEAFLDKLKLYDVDYVGGLELGAVPLTASVVSRSHIIDNPVSGFIVRKEEKDHGTKKQIEGLTLDESLSGKRVAVLEDVTTTGKSAEQVVKILREVGAEVVVVITILDRVSGARELFKNQGIDFESIFTSDEFKKIPVFDSTKSILEIWKDAFWFFNIK